MTELQEKSSITAPPSQGHVDLLAVPEGHRHWINETDQYAARGRRHRVLPSVNSRITQTGRAGDEKPHVDNLQVPSDQLHRSSTALETSGSQEGQTPNIKPLVSSGQKELVS
ncbi:unnamed protein product [Pleuronectes platessa]|uniref:Uncharacterized protein n=1 Tax=Pleuronectes platessa TaxID=8262 RepID=A0A9N7UI78_PLEPL|nr:unnamed protein product [Pleuronectes platessa]